MGFIYTMYKYTLTFLPLLVIGWYDINWSLTPSLYSSTAMGYRRSTRLISASIASNPLALS